MITQIIIEQVQDLMNWGFAGAISLLLLATALVVLGLLVAGAAFYFWKGTMQLHEPPTGRKIRRFTGWQMAIHWTTAYSFVTLAITVIHSIGANEPYLRCIGRAMFAAHA